MVAQALGIHDTTSGGSRVGESDVRLASRETAERDEKQGSETHFAPSGTSALDSGLAVEPRRALVRVPETPNGCPCKLLGRASVL